MARRNLTVAELNLKRFNAKRRPARPIELTQRLRDAFWARAIKADGDKCWGWNGSLSAGYAHVGKFLGSRVSFAIHYYLPPVDMHICHSCDNPVCTNPAHLVLGTHHENVNDAKCKRRLKPRANPNFKGDGDRLFKEMEMLELGKQGLDSLHIAHRLGIPFRTVDITRRQFRVEDGGTRMRTKFR